MLTSKQIGQQVVAMFSGSSPARVIDTTTLWRRLKVPKKSWLGVDLCLETSERLYLVFELETQQIPARVMQAWKHAKATKRASVIIVARDRLLAKPSQSDGEDNPEPPTATRARHITESISEDCIANGFGLIAEGSNRLHLIFPPDYSPPVVATTVLKEPGHIPSWLRERIVSCDGLSPALSTCLKTFNEKYEAAIRNDRMRYSHEARLLRDLAESISDTVPRFYFPLDLLEILRNWEQSGVVKKRDHFFHTFNNFFAGLLVLGPLCQTRLDSLVPDTYIRSNEATLRPWEVLWPLVSLLHDPGYMSEEISSMFDYGLGVRTGALGRRQISAADKESIRNLWDTQFAVARKDLVHLFDMVSGRWALTGSSDDLTARFEKAMSEAYFNGTKCGHSLLSGLRIITECSRANRVSLPNGYNEQSTKKASIIAALSMMFHDPHTREVFEEHGIPSIAFELLPYAATLVFVDGLQEDRRDISAWQFSRECIFSDLHVDTARSKVHATVNLSQLPIKYWGAKILEFESCLAWINAASDTKFSIDYRTACNLQLSQNKPIRRYRV